MEISSPKKNYEGYNKWPESLRICHVNKLNIPYSSRGANVKITDIDLIKEESLNYCNCITPEHVSGYVSIPWNGLTSMG